MTLLANEATADSRKLLKKHTKEDASDYEDLEVKLANLYFKTNDKLGLEKEMAEIHPHKKWLLKHIAPKVEIKKEEVKIEVKPEEKKSSIEGATCSSCEALKTYSNFNNQNNPGQNINYTHYVALIGMVAVVGALFIVISKKN